MFKRKRPFVIMGIFSLLFGGCNEQPNPAPKAETQIRQSKPFTAPPEVTSEEEDGFHDLVFYIQDYNRMSDGSQSIRASGIYKGRKLGFEVVLGPTWKSGSLDKSIPLVTYQGFVTYHSTGIESDSFIQTVDELYGTKLSPKMMSKQTRFTGISLEGDPRDLSKGSTKIKLFFESENDDEYAELFSNIELDTRRFEFHEKDPDYRPAIVKALQAR